MASSRRATPPPPSLDDHTNPGSVPDFDEEHADLTDAGHPADDFDDDEQDEVTNPEGTPDPPPPGAFNAERLLRLLRAVQALLLEQLPSFLVPLVFFALTAVLDFVIAGRAWWLLPLTGALKGVGWAFYLERVVRLTGPVHTSARVVVWPLLILASAALAYSLGGAVLWLGLLAVPLVEAVLVAGVVGGLTVVTTLLRSNAVTWLVAQGAGLLGVGLVSVVVTAFGQAALGDLFGGLLGAVLVAPLVHAWAVLRALWVRAPTRRSRAR